MTGLDGILRSRESEQRLNRTFASAFAGEDGAAVLSYLRSITIEMVSGPDLSDPGLRHLEGQRYLVGLIERRVNAEKRKHNG